MVGRRTKLWFPNSLRNPMWLAAVAALALTTSCDTIGSAVDTVASDIRGGGHDQGDNREGDEGECEDGNGSVLTSRNNNSRTGANLGERILKPSNVSVDNFGLVNTHTLQGKVYAQPLYVAGLSIPNVGRRNVVYVVTEHNMVYAFDADDTASDTPLWSRNLGPSVPSVDVNVPGRNCVDITP